MRIIQISVSVIRINAKASISWRVTAYILQMDNAKGIFYCLFVLSHIIENKFYETYVSSQEGKFI